MYQWIGKCEPLGKGLELLYEIALDLHIRMCHTNKTECVFECPAIFKNEVRCCNHTASCYWEKSLVLVHNFSSNFVQIRTHIYQEENAQEHILLFRTHHQ